MKLAPTIREKAKEMLRSGESYRIIARQLGIALTTVQHVSRRLDTPAEPDEWDGIKPPPLEGPAYFCPGCRVHVRMPCLACQLRARMARRAPV